jgi:hypothetical protein
MQFERVNPDSDSSSISESSSDEDTGARVKMYELKDGFEASANEQHAQEKSKSFELDFATRITNENLATNDKIRTNSTGNMSITFTPSQKNRKTIKK